MSTVATSRAARIARLNDALRRAHTKGAPIGGLFLGAMLVTVGVQALDPAARAAVLHKVGDHTDFPEGDDPYGEHDFGAFEHDGQRIFWKITYYDRQAWNAGQEIGTSTPEESWACFRVLTVMLADEY